MTGFFSRLSAFLKSRRTVPARGSEYVVGLDTREPQFMVPHQALTVRLPHDPTGATRWVWDGQPSLGLDAIAPLQVETTADGRLESVWRFRATAEFGTCFLCFHLDDVDPSGGPGPREFTLTVRVGRY